MEYLTSDKILKTNDIVFEDVSVPEWGGTVCVRSIDGAERDEFEGGSIKEVRVKERGRYKTKHKANMTNYRARLVALAVCKGVNDPTPSFNPSQVIALGTKNAAALDRVFAVAQRLAGITEEDIEEYEKN